MIISIEWNRTEGLKAGGHISGIALEHFELQPAAFEVKAILEKLVAAFPETLNNVNFVWFDPPDIGGKHEKKADEEKA